MRWQAASSKTAARSPCAKKSAVLPPFAGGCRAPSGRSPTTCSPWTSRTTHERFRSFRPAVLGVTGVRFWTEEEWLAHRDAQQGNSRLITDEVSDAVAIDEQDQ